MQKLILNVLKQLFINFHKYEKYMQKSHKKVSVNYILPGNVSFLKGYYDFVNGNDANPSAVKKMANCFNFFKIICVMFVSVTVAMILEWFISNYTTTFDLKVDEKPKNFNSNRGDYCMKDSDGNIIKCITHPSYIARCILSVSLTLMFIIAAIIMSLLISTMIYKIYECFYGIWETFDDYKIYRKKIKEDVKENLVTIV